MLQIGKTIISQEIFDFCFLCDLKKCKGACCVEGDAGAPLELDECNFLEDNIDIIKPYLSEEGLNAIENQHVFILDDFGDGFVTPLINEKDCAFSYKEDGITYCAIEKAFIDKKVSLRKPISCYLYPIRITKYKEFEAINYHKWDICNDACVNGKREKVALYKFLKEPLIVKYGKEWYNDLVNCGKELKWIE